MYKFKGKDSSFQTEKNNPLPPVYFPLANELGLLSAITPSLAGDIKLDQHSFLLPPVSFEDLHTNRATRNFWISFGDKKIPPWSLTGNSVWQKAADEDEFDLEAGFLWQKITRQNKKLGIRASVLNFVPPHAGTFEVMYVEIENMSKKTTKIVGTAAIPLFGRSADNIRDHRHVTSLLHRLSSDPYGIRLCPTMSFNERGHLKNQTSYYVFGVDDKAGKPQGFYPTWEAFIGPGGSFDNPLALVHRQNPVKKIGEPHQGKEALGGLQFTERTLKPGERVGYTLFLGIDPIVATRPPFAKFTGRTQVEKEWEITRKFWLEKVGRIQFQTGQADFDQWIRWVQLQPSLRKIYGCSFLPDFDYGRGGRGWRDLWQDCLALLLANPAEVREDLIGNFGGVRLDGSNATIIGRHKNEQGKWVPDFIADRNNIVRTWMDHGVWPFLTTLLYINQTGDRSILFEKVSYFKDGFIFRGQKIDEKWRQGADSESKLKTSSGEIVWGTVLEHILVQTLVPFYHVGEHNIIRLEDADWNDGLDMAKERGESVAFTAMYAGNMKLLADLLERISIQNDGKNFELTEEILPLLDTISQPINYDKKEDKQTLLYRYFESISQGILGSQQTIPTSQIVADLRKKADWMAAHLNHQEWVDVKSHSWVNGYYDNKGERVEGVHASGQVKMTLAGQVYPIMAGLLDRSRMHKVIQAVDKYLWDGSLGGVRLNTNFGDTQPHLGRAFSFAYGEKENGAIFSHMAVMYAYALYKQEWVNAGHRVLNGLFSMAHNSKKSRIFPGLPEYFNNEGSGRYSYLTGSASWYILTLLTQVFGVRGDLGDLVLAPKLTPDQWDKSGKASVRLNFAGCLLNITFINLKKLDYDHTIIKTVHSTDGEIPFHRDSPHVVRIPRQEISKHKELHLQIVLEGGQ